MIPMRQQCENRNGEHKTALIWYVQVILLMERDTEVMKMFHNMIPEKMYYIRKKGTIRENTRSP